MIRNGRIVQQVVFRTGVEELFAWVTEPERVATWMGTAARIDLQTGGIYSCKLTGAHVWDGLVVEVVAPQRLVVTLGWRDPGMGMPAGMSLVEWDFARDPRGSRLRMVHQHVPPDLLALHNTTWARLYARLRSVLAGKSPGPHPLLELVESEAGKPS